MKTFLVLRLSSMGDVLLALPVIRGVLDCNPGISIIFVTNRRFVPYFEGIERLTVISFNPDSSHRGAKGLWRLFRQVDQSARISAVIDLHGVLRTFFLDALFLIKLRRVYRVDKYRKIKREIILKRKMNRLPHAIVRYVNVFKKAGINGSVHPAPFSHIPGFAMPIRETDRPIRIGMAPLAAHQTKNWGLERSAGLIRLILEHGKAEIHLFGGKADHPLLQPLSGGDVFNQAGQLDPVKELILIGSMDAFISMDSANMHLASLAGVPTISIWGGTHPDLGFAPVNQPYDQILQAPIHEVKCRPCSVYGENPCHLAVDPMRCMKSITPGMVYHKLSEILRRLNRTD